MGRWFRGGKLEALIEPHYPKAGNGRQLAWPRDHAGGLPFAAAVLGLDPGAEDAFFV